MLGELELIRLIEENEYPARLIEAGVVWVELEITDSKTNAVRRERLSKSAFADLILDWRERGTRHPPELNPPPRQNGSAPQPAFSSAKNTRSLSARARSLRLADKRRTNQKR